MLAVDELSVFFHSAQSRMRPMVDKVTLSLERGEILAVIGETGSGKSLMGLAICNMLPDNAEVKGQISLEGSPLLSLSPSEMRHYLGSRIAYVPQSAGLSLNPTMRCNMQVAEVYQRRNSIPRKPASKSADKLLSSLGLSAEKRYPHMLSGGMKQRVLISIGLASRPDILIADEPTKGLDSALCSHIAEIFLDLHTTSPDMGILLITHDLNLAEYIADNIAVMYAGQIVEVSPGKDFFNRPRHPYSRALLAALPERGLKPLEGIAPRPDQIITGCSFHPRCDFATSRCHAFRPAATGSFDNFYCCWNHA